MGERVKYSLPLGNPGERTPSWWLNLHESYVSEEDFYTIDEFVREESIGKLITDDSGRYYVSIEFETKEDLTWFLLKYS